MTGITAWFGLHDIGRVRPGETVLVNAAAGAVGSVVVQLAVHAGARVVAVAGSASKLRHVRELGAHEAVDYNAPAFDEALARACKPGVDVFLNNVGGRQLAGALPLMRPHGRVVLCGRMSGLGADADPGLVDIGPAVRTAFRSRASSWSTISIAGPGSVASWPVCWRRASCGR